MRTKSSPLHIAIILDGNRRYGRRIGDKSKGHKEGVKRVKDLFNWAEELKIKELTLYCFSTENFNRPKYEVSFLMKLFKSQFRELLKDERVKNGKARINFIGRLNLFSVSLQKEMAGIMQKTKEADEIIINFAVGYGGKSEITDAFKKIAKKGIKPEEINEDLINENLYISNEPDILIRTGGDKRLSNFLLWQCAYSEIFFLDKLWPEFSKEDLILVIKEFNKRERRFGE